MKKHILKLISNLFQKFKNIYFNLMYEDFKKKYEIHRSFKFNGENILFYGEGKIIIDENSYIGWNSTIEAAPKCKVSIGRNCHLSHNVRIYTASNNPDQNFDVNQTKEKVYGDVIIGNGVWIGANVFINPGITIEDNTVIGSNSVVTKDIEKNTIVGGVPARLIRHKNV